MTTDIKDLPRLLSVLQSLPLWLFIALAFAGYGALFIPGFGGADLTAFRREWGWVCWLDAITFTIFSVTYAVDLLAKRIRIRAKRMRRHEENLYRNVYSPLYAELMKIQIITSSATLAPYLRQRAEKAWAKFRAIKNKRIAIKIAWITLFDKQITKETGEVDYGGVFPIERINHVVHATLAYCDDELFRLTSRAVNNRKEEHINSGEVTYDDVLLFRHIIKQRDRLRKSLLS
jgi:hypothetical protein